MKYLMDLCKSDKQGIWERFVSDWTRRNWLTDIFLYGFQVAAVLYSLVMVLEINVPIF